MTFKKTYIIAVIIVHRIELIMLYLLLASLFLFGHTVSSSVQISLKIWWNTLIPGMLVPMIMIRFIHARQGFAHLCSKIFNRCFAMSNNAFAYVICAMLLGFPSGSLFIDEAYGQDLLNKQGAKRILLCCCFPTPGFVILSLGALYQDPSIGWRLYLIQILSGCILLWFTRSIHVNAYSQPSKLPPFFESLTKAIRTSVQAMTMIGIYLILFLSFLSVLETILPDQLLLPLQLTSEFSSAVLLAAQFPCSSTIKLILTSALLSFGGLCVHVQIFSSLRNLSLSYPHFLFFRILQAIVSMILSYFFF